MTRALLAEGDVLAKGHKNGTVRRYRVEGYTPRGKVRMRNLQTGGESSAWWANPEHLPKGYYVESRAVGG